MMSMCRSTGPFGRMDGSRDFLMYWSRWPRWIRSSIWFFKSYPQYYVRSHSGSNSNVAVSDLSGLGVFRSPFSQIWRKISVRVELSGTLSSRGMGALLIFMFLHHQSLGGDVLVGPLQHLWYSYRGLLHKRPKKVGKPDLDHKSLDDQRWMRIENGPDIVYEASEVLSKVFLLLLSHPEEGCDNWLPSGAREEIALELPCELIKGVN
ncbi:hypothetical protein BHM03_00025853 [Ensete ventricosum]|nr:hypothetical protein BHM03_00025853 [Ensete ventricosum]